MPVTVTVAELVLLLRERLRLFRSHGDSENDLTQPGRAGHSLVVTLWLTRVMRRPGDYGCLTAGAPVWPGPRPSLRPIPKKKMADKKHVNGTKRAPMTINTNNEFHS